jgi:hypothetical protein
MTDRWIVFVTDRNQLKQLECEPEVVLSMEEALHEVLTPKSRPTVLQQHKDFADTQQLAFTEPILGHLQVPPEHKGAKSEAFRVMIGVLKNKLRSNIPAMSSAFQMRIREAVALEVAPPKGTFVHRKALWPLQSLKLTHEFAGPDQYEQDHGDWQKVRLMPALLRIFTRVNLMAFIGEDQGMQLSTGLSKRATRLTSDSMLQPTASRSTKML